MFQILNENKLQYFCAGKIFSQNSLKVLTRSIVNVHYKYTLKKKKIKMGWVIPKFNALP